MNQTPQTNSNNQTKENQNLVYISFLLLYLFLTIIYYYYCTYHVIFPFLYFYYTHNHVLSIVRLQRKSYKKNDKSVSL